MSALRFAEASERLRGPSARFASATLRKFVAARAPQPAREGACAPQISAYPRQSRFEAESGDEFLARRNLLKPLFVLEGTLFMMVGQAPKGLDAEKRSVLEFWVAVYAVMVVRLSS